MCGIFGIINISKIDNEIIKSTSSRLFKLSESRGKEASGMALANKKNIYVLKSSVAASKLVKKNEYKKLFSDSLNISALIGHARLVTNGSLEHNTNNQPVIKYGTVCVHNGIIVNDRQIWKNHPDIKREFEVDTEVLPALLNKYLSITNDIYKATDLIFKEIRGTVSTAILFRNNNELLLATNNGSLYICEADNLLLFASEYNILKNTINQKFLARINFSKIKHINANSGFLINLASLEKKFIDLKDKNKTNRIKIDATSPKYIRNLEISNIKINEINHPKKSSNLKKENLSKFIPNINIADSLKRCTKCILPETMPFIEFDDAGECNYCRHYQPQKLLDKNKLKKSIAPCRRNDGKADCLVALSGGRDSSYGLHLIKKGLGLNPIAYSYDWGMITDLGRRNQARMCGELGVEHILISADIRKKRNYIRRNVLTWLKNPNLGIVPLFMAGDKQYFHYINKLKKDLDLKLIIYSENPLEKTDFKTGFCGVSPKWQVDHLYDFDLLNKIKLGFFYTKNFIKNPSYINTSFIDTLWAYLSSYFISHEYLYLFKYYKWNEDEINNTLINNYNWELAKDTETTWRIGDGTAAFYNYIYYVMAGFTENDTFRSNQIREGQITREEGLALAQRDNYPRFESIQWYCDTINIDFNKTLETINGANKLYNL